MERTLILPTPPAQVPLRRAVPGGAMVEVAFPVETDPRTIDQSRPIGVNPLQWNEITIGLSQAQATIAALSSQLAAALVVIEALATNPDGGWPQQARDALTHVRAFAAQCTIAPVASSALDEITTD